MKSVAVIIAILPLALLAGACTRDGAHGPRGAGGVVAPEPPSPFGVREASWVVDRGEVARAASVAAAHPLVRRALEEGGGARLALVPGYALRGSGRTDGDRAIAVTILPFVTDGDSTHATFISLLESEAEAAVSHAEIIWGRDPRPDETGYEAFDAGGARGWIREDELRIVGMSRGGLLAPERLNWQKFLTCFSTMGPQLCSQGTSVANQVAPSVPYHEAIGCAVGTAVAAVGCAAAAWGK
jgi:hypothetical protein